MVSMTVRYQIHGVYVVVEVHLLIGQIWLGGDHLVWQGVTMSLHSSLLPYVRLRSRLPLTHYSNGRSFCQPKITHIKLLSKVYKVVQVHDVVTKSFVLYTWRTPGILRKFPKYSSLHKCYYDSQINGESDRT